MRSNWYSLFRYADYTSIKMAHERSFSTTYQKNKVHTIFAGSLTILLVFFRSITAKKMKCACTDPFYLKYPSKMKFRTQP